MTFPPFQAPVTRFSIFGIGLVFRSGFVHFAVGRYWPDLVSFGCGYIRVVKANCYDFLTRFGTHLIRKCEGSKKLGLFSYARFEYTVKKTLADNSKFESCLGIF